MNNFFQWLFSSAGFMPHGHCYLWQPGTLWLNVGSDGLIATAYFAIPASLYTLVRRRITEIPFPGIFLMFAAFILLCGLTHVMEIWTVWNPAYRLGGGLKLVTGLVSLATTITLFRLMPLALQLRSPQALQREVEARTAELATANANLQRTVRELERQREDLEAAHREKNESLALLETTLRSVGDAVISTDAAGAVQFMNRVAESLTGWSESEAQGRPLDEVFRIVHEETRAVLESPVTKVLREGRIVGLANHAVLISRDQIERPIEDSGAPIRESGNLLGVVLVFRDATTKRADERALQESEQRFRGAVDAVEGILWTNSAAGQMQSEQPGWAALTGQTSAEYQGYGWLKAVHKEDAQSTLDAWNAAVAAQQPFVFEHRVRRHDGQWRRFAIRALPRRNAMGEIREWVGVHIDVTEQRRVEAALHEANARKDVFLATLSHELRNPLAPIRNAATVLAKTDLTPEDRERSRLIIVRQVRHMASLLDDLLDISRITRGVFTLKKQVVNLQGLLAEALETARPLIDAKRHKVELDWPSLPIQVTADPVRVVQIAGNLLTNAAKYTDPEGLITFEVKTADTGIIITVRDTGIGLESSMLHQVFEMFSQVAPDQQRSEGGLGIGLALVKGLVELHGGSIEARSAGLERGSEFVVTLPRLLVTDAAHERAPESREISRVGTSKRVLIADDNHDGAESLAMLIELSGHTAYVTYTGVDALHLADIHHPQVAILDIGMPGMDGYQVAQQIRNQPWGVDMILIALTGWGQEGDKRRALGAGFDHHLTKPVDPNSLDQLLTRDTRVAR